MADFNADGSPDLVVVGGGPTPKVLVLINNGSGTGFSPAAGSDLLGAPSDLAVGDLTGDGKPDAAVLEGGNDVIQVFPGIGDGTFGSPIGLILPSGSGGVRVAVGDINSDGVVDVLALNRGPGSVSTFLNQAGGFTAGQTPINSNVGANPIAFSVFDFNGDAKLDAAVANDAGVGGIFLGGP